MCRRGSRGPGPVATCGVQRPGPVHRGARLSGGATPKRPTGEARDPAQRPGLGRLVDVECHQPLVQGEPERGQTLVLHGQQGLRRRGVVGYGECGAAQTVARRADRARTLMRVRMFTFHEVEALGTAQGEARVRTRFGADLPPDMHEARRPASPTPGPNTTRSAPNPGESAEWPGQDLYGRAATASTPDARSLRAKNSISGIVPEWAPAKTSLSRVLTSARPMPSSARRTRVIAAFLAEGFHLEARRSTLREQPTP